MFNRDNRQKFLEFNELSSKYKIPYLNLEIKIFLKSRKQSLEAELEADEEVYNLVCPKIHDNNGEPAFTIKTGFHKLQQRHQRKQ